MIAGDGAAGARREAARRRLAELSPREHEVALAIARGLSNAEIAAELHISVATVKSHTTQLLAKLEAGNRVQIALRVTEATSLPAGAPPPEPADHGPGRDREPQPPRRVEVAADDADERPDREVHERDRRPGEGHQPQGEEMLIDMGHLSQRHQEGRNEHERGDDREHAREHADRPGRQQ